ncbi:MAG: ATP-binding protein [Thermodesulfobacteriota bacterium]
MSLKPLETKFLPAERASKDDIVRAKKRVLGIPLLGQILNGIPDGVLILNAERQAVFANSSLLQYEGLREEDALGLRPGEILGCIHVEEDFSCGTTEFCRYCGAAKVLAQNRLRQKAANECRILRRHKGETVALDLLVWGTPFSQEGQEFILFVVSDISHEKRRRALERIFFHDILNAAGWLRSLTALLLDEEPDKTEEYLEHILEASDILINDIEAQKLLQAAESRELRLRPKPFHSVEFLRGITKRFSKIYSRQHLTFKLDPGSSEFGLISDPNLINRCLSNLLKNAAEASQSGQTITLGCRQIEDQVDLWVHNAAFMAQETQMQIFHRSFSTKDPGRGLGLYSVKLLVERYLKGIVSFDSTPVRGTTFHLLLPLDIADTAD